MSIIEALGSFVSNNPHCAISIEGDELRIDTPWGSKDCRLVFKYQEDTQFVEVLNKIKFNPSFDAIIHTDNDLIEFVFAYLNPKSDDVKGYIDREFTVYFDGAEISCKFAEPSDQLMTIARAYRRMPSEEPTITVPQLLAFRDFQRMEKLPESNKRYFVGRIPRNFFVKSSSGLSGLDLEMLARNLNFVVRYYDRVCPVIVVRGDEKQVNEDIKPLRYIENGFPLSISVRKIDDILLKLIEVAHVEKNPRFAFLYYYQVFEYVGYYYLDYKVRSHLIRLLRNPTVVNCTEENLDDFISIMSDYSHSDDVRMKKAIEEKCDPCIIWKEIENDKDFFCQQHIFDGGFQLNALISQDTSEESWKAMWMPKLFDSFVKIRNCLVHAREKRESKVILPTVNNDKKIERHLPVIARAAEQLAVCT